MSRIMYTVAGLGNPGEKYERTRHNAGRIAVAAWVTSRGGSFVASKKYHALINEGSCGKEEVLALLPETYMNESGGSVKKVVTSKAAIERLIVVYDEIDLPLGTIRVAFDRGSGGHNGVRSIESALKSKRFTRIRVGVSPKGKEGAKKPRGEAAVLKLVMGEFTKAEAKTLEDAIARAGEAIECIITEGVAVAMNKFN
jgi:PTH1 family peptidyl-tRNA hydrolase